MGVITANPQRAKVEKAADWQQNDQRWEHRLRTIRNFTGQSRLCCLIKPWPSEVRGKQASQRLPSDAHPLRAFQPLIFHARSPSYPFSLAPSSDCRIFQPGLQFPQLTQHTYHLLPEEVKLGFQPLQGAGMATSWGARGWGGRRGGRQGVREAAAAAAATAACATSAAPPAGVLVPIQGNRLLPTERAH